MAIIPVSSQVKYSACWFISGISPTRIQRQGNSVVAAIGGIQYKIIYPDGRPLLHRTAVAIETRIRGKGERLKLKGR